MSCRLFGLVALCCVSIGMARAGPAFLAELSAHAGTELRWSDPQELSLYSQPVHVRQFSSSLGLPEAAARLAAHQDRFQRVLVSHNTILLSGMAREWHWVAQLSKTGGGVNGMVSTLHVPPFHPERVSAQGMPGSSSWLVPEALLRHRQRIDAGSTPVVQEIHTAGLPESEFLARAEQHLRAWGWRKGSSPGWLAGGQAWQRGKENIVLRVTPVSVPGQAAIFLHRF